jgi:hypothetical protein
MSISTRSSRLLVAALAIFAMVVFAGPASATLFSQHRTTASKAHAARCTATKATAARAHHRHTATKASTARCTTKKRTHTDTPGSGSGSTPTESGSGSNSGSTNPGSGSGTSSGTGSNPGSGSGTPAPTPGPAPMTPVSPVAPIGPTAPVLSVHGDTISWTAIPGVTSYTLATILNPTTTRETTYTHVTGTSVTPPAVPGQTVNYGLATNAPVGGPWAQEVTIAYPAPVSSPPTETPPASPSPASSMLIGVNAGEGNNLTEIKGAVDSVRVDTAGSISSYTAAGLKVIDDMSGPYNEGGVSAINASQWASEAVAWVKANPEAAAVEVLNEPGGEWFWGPNAESTTNKKAYAKLLEDVHEDLVAAFGTKHPPVLASYDGGHDSSVAWGEGWWQYVNHEDVEGVTVHPYGGTGSRTSSALGNRRDIELAHSQTGKPVYITEIGWPTAVGQPSTGDSLQWTEAEQAANITSFIDWAKSTGYVADVSIFNWVDYGTNDFYGILSKSGQHKLSYAALAAFPH